MSEALWSYANVIEERLLPLFYGVSVSFLSPADRRNANWNKVENTDHHVFVSAYMSVRRRRAGGRWGGGTSHHAVKRGLYL